jgi:hypothetical protein
MRVMIAGDDLLVQVRYNQTTSWHDPVTSALLQNQTGMKRVALQL